MTKLFVMAVPILEGKTEQWKEFANDLKGRYQKEFNESRKNLGIQERTYLQSTPGGDMVIVVLEGKDPEAAFEKFGEGEDEFSMWFIDQVRALHGLDLTEKPDYEMPQLILETEPIEEHAQY